MKFASLDMLEESLIKKLDLLKKIQYENSRQKDILSDPQNFDEAAFDRTLDTKETYIEHLISLDDGFQSLFDRVKEEIEKHKEDYASQIKRMQMLIQEITAESATVEAEERRNKKLAEKCFSLSRQHISQSKQTSAAAFNYYQTMNNFKNIPPQFMDQKN